MQGSLFPSGEANPVDVVIAHYQTYHPRAKPGENERKKIKARLKEGYSVGDLKQAIDGCHASPFHCGENDRGRRYQSLELIVRSSDKVAQFIELAEQGAGPQYSRSTSRTLSAAKNFLSNTSGRPPRIEGNDT